MLPVPRVSQLRGVAAAAVAFLTVAAASSAAVSSGADGNSATPQEVITAIAIPVSDPLPPPAASVEEAAIALIVAVGGVETEDGTCAESDLAVRWSLPDEGFEYGAHVEPLGPAPTEDTDEVSGIVVCEGSTLAYAGFEAFRTDEGWRVTHVPYLAEEDVHGTEPDDLTGLEAAPIAPDKPTSTAAPASPGRAPTGGSTGSAIEGYAAYDPQRKCDPSAKPGTVALAQWLLERYPGTRSYGIVRACNIGGRSEHKEGRAFDWGANVGNAAERAAVDDFIRLILATDEHGNRHALARRMGVMYVVWNGQIWSSYYADQGWRRYSGPNPHTDHVHLSLSWAGAMGTTSFFTGEVANVPTAAPTGTGTQPAPAPAPAPSPSGTSTGPAPSPSPTKSDEPKQPKKPPGHSDPLPSPTSSPSPSPSPTPTKTASPSPSPSPSPTSEPPPAPKPGGPDKDGESAPPGHEKKKKDTEPSELEPSEPAGPPQEDEQDGPGHGGGKPPGKGKGKG